MKLDNLLVIHIEPDFAHELVWHKVAVRRTARPFGGPRMAWKTLLHRHLVAHIPNWNPQGDFKAMPGTFRDFYTPFQMWVWFETTADKQQAEQLLAQQR